MKYQIMGTRDGEACVIYLKPEAVAKVVILFPTDGPEGSIGKMITPEAAQIEKEKEVDVSLDGILVKNKQ